jgi:hypothetical protein
LASLATTIDQLEALATTSLVDDWCGVVGVGGELNRL